MARIPEQLKSFVNKGTVADAVTLVARHGTIVSLEAVGYQDLESKKAMRSDTIFDIRSVTKPVTVIGIMILMEEGKLALNDPIEKFLPKFKAATRKTEHQFIPITIHHLLTHTAGLPLYRLPESDEMAIKRNRTLVDYVLFLSKHMGEILRKKKNTSLPNQVLLALDHGSLTKSFQLLECRRGTERLWV